MRWAAPYEHAVACTAGPEPGAHALLDWLRDTYQGWSGGIYNCRAVRGTATTSIHGEGRAVDWMLPVGEDGRGTAYGHQIVKDLGRHGRQLGVQFVIYDRRAWSAVAPRGRAYTGVHPHYDHLHIELTRSAARTLTVARVRSITRTTPAPAGPAPRRDMTIGEFMATLTPQEQDDLRGLLRAFRAGDKPPVSGHQVGSLLRAMVPAARDADWRPDVDLPFAAESRRAIVDGGGNARTGSYVAQWYRRVNELLLGAGQGHRPDAAASELVRRLEQP